MDLECSPESGASIAAQHDVDRWVSLCIDTNDPHYIAEHFDGLFDDFTNLPLTRLLIQASQKSRG